MTDWLFSSVGRSARESMKLLREIQKYREFIPLAVEKAQTATEAHNPTTPAAEQLVLPEAKRRADLIKWFTKTVIPLAVLAPHTPIDELIEQLPEPERSIGHDWLLEFARPAGRK